MAPYGFYKLPKQLKLPLMPLPACVLFDATCSPQASRSSLMPEHHCKVPFFSSSLHQHNTRGASICQLSPFCNSHLELLLFVFQGLRNCPHLAYYRKLSPHNSGSSALHKSPSTIHLQDLLLQLYQLHSNSSPKPSFATSPAGGCTDYSHAATPTCHKVKKRDLTSLGKASSLLSTLAALSTWLQAHSQHSSRCPEANGS